MNKGSKHYNNNAEKQLKIKKASKEQYLKNNSLSKTAT